MRHFTTNSVVAGVLEEIGIRSLVDTDEPEIYGFIETTVETLQNYQEAHFYYLVQDDDEVFDQLADNPIKPISFQGIWVLFPVFIC
ncbi:hypothetical protein [Halobacillus andaensis]|nr:hypothetical protein [Halobacillus andaensis]MBP2005300.1 hypothetical protein [Halobacillus andaensis]